MTSFAHTPQTRRPVGGSEVKLIPIGRLLQRLAGLPTGYPAADTSAGFERGHVPLLRTIPTCPVMTGKDWRLHNTTAWRLAFLTGLIIHSSRSTSVVVSRLTLMVRCTAMTQIPSSKSKSFH